MYQKGTSKIRTLKIPEFWPPFPPLFALVRFRELPPPSPTICHDFPSPDLLEGPKDGKIKENAKFFSF